MSDSVQKRDFGQQIADLLEPHFDLLEMIFEHVDENKQLYQSDAKQIKTRFLCKMLKKKSLKALKKQPQA